MLSEAAKEINVECNSIKLIDLDCTTVFISEAHMRVQYLIEINIYTIVKIQQ